MNIKSFLIELHRRNPVLSITGWAHLLVLAGAIAGVLLDTRQILGINPWIKPAKFAISNAAFLWTMGWILEYLAGHLKAARRISWGIAVAMVFEIVSVSLQSFRGIPSHFNFTTPLNSLIFGLMGIFILLNTVLIGYVLFLFFRQTPVRSTAYIWGIRLGLIIFIGSGFIGRAMVEQGSHTVGAEDGGPGMPVMNWSTEAGDLRASHAIGLHALQLLPLIGFQVGRSRVSELRQDTLVWIASILYAALVLGVYFQALQGHPFMVIGTQ